jgi:plasmid stabilization system protein ParE
MRIRWTQPATNDLLRICEYTEHHDGPQTARRLALRLYEGINSLVEFPLRARPGRKEGTREMVLRSYLSWPFTASATIQWKFCASLMGRSVGRERGRPRLAPSGWGVGLRATT